MTILSSQHQKRDELIDPIFVLFLLTLGLLMIFAVSAGDVHDPIGTLLGSFGNTTTHLSLDVQTSFAADLQYWDTYCSHGWSADSMCEAIASRSQSCWISIDSAYCSEYTKYLKQYSIK